VAETDAEACAREQCPHTARRAVKAIGQDTAGPIRRLLLERCLLKRSIGLGKRRCTGGRRVPQVPDKTATDNGGQIDLGGETTAVLLIRQEIHRERHPTPGQHWHQALAAKRTDETIEGQRGHMIEHRTEFQTETPMSGQKGIARDLGSYLAIAQDKMRQDGEDSFARGALDPPDGDATQADTGIMRVARQGTHRRHRSPCGGAESRGRGGTRIRIQQRPCRRQAAENRSRRLENRR
jgi:hypothetical protein